MPRLAPSDLVVRQLAPPDAPLIHDAFTQLSIESRYLRYGVPLLDPAVALGWVDELDSPGNAAVGAVTPARRRLIGCARYASGEAGTYAEVAVTVIDSWQGRGVGARLLVALMAHAGDRGIAELRACLLPGNKRAQRLIAAVEGWRLRGRRDGYLEYGYAPRSADRSASVITYDCPS
jgi:RimJ/RimL family protein N-acetyltransferase